VDQLSVQKRALAAIVIAILFFVLYDYFYLAKFRNLDTNSTATQTEMQTQTAPQSGASNPAAANTPAPQIAQNRLLAKVVSDNFIISIDEFGQISSYELSGEIYKDEEEKQINLVNFESDLKPLQIRFADTNLNALAFSTPYSASASEIKLSSEPATLTLSQNLGETQVVKNLKFYPDGHYDLDVKVSGNAEYFITPGARPNVVVDGYTVHGALLEIEEGKLEIVKDGKLAERDFNEITIASAFDRYYTSLFYEFDKKLNIILSEDKSENIQIFAKSSGDFSASGYIGPKEYKVLKSVNPRLTSVIEYGWFTFIAKPMFLFLSWLKSFIGNWGWAIVVMTIIIRVILFPLTYRGMVSMNKLKDIGPQMKEIQEKYRDNPEKMRSQTMELYKKSGVNPFGGCLPILIQIPIFFAIYRVLLNAIELKGSPWILWIQDLAIKDPYFVLPILMGILMFVQQKMTPTNFTDPMQEKIMKFLPVIFTFIFMTFPAGLTLYWCVNNLCSVVQQYFVNKMFKRYKTEAAEEKREKELEKKEQKRKKANENRS